MNEYKYEVERTNRELQELKKKYYQQRRRDQLIDEMDSSGPQQGGDKENISDFDLHFDLYFDDCFVLFFLNLFGFVSCALYLFFFYFFNSYDQNSVKSDSFCVLYCSLFPLHYLNHSEQ